VMRLRVRQGRMVGGGQVIPAGTAFLDSGAAEDEGARRGPPRRSRL